MKKITLILIAVLISYTSYAKKQSKEERQAVLNERKQGGQSKEKKLDEFKVDNNGGIYYSEVVKVDSLSKLDLYLRSKVFFANSFKSANSVIQMDDKEEAIIIGKGTVKIYIGSGFGAVPSTMNFTLKIQSREGRYKYEIYNISYRSDALGELSAEYFYKKENYYKKNGKPRRVNQNYKEQTMSKISNIVILLTNSMKSSKSKSEKDDW